MNETETCIHICGMWCYYSVFNASHDLIILNFNAKSAVSLTRFNVNYVHVQAYKINGIFKIKINKSIICTCYN